MRCKRSWYMRGFNEMRMCICFELCYGFFCLFGVKCIELWWYDSAQPSGWCCTYVGKEQWSSEEPMRRYGQTSCNKFRLEKPDQTSSERDYHFNFWSCLYFNPSNRFFFFPTTRKKKKKKKENTYIKEKKSSI